MTKRKTPETSTTTTRSAAKSTPTTRLAAKSPPAERPAAKSAPTARRRAEHPRSVPVPEVETYIDAAPDQPFEEGVRDVIGPDLRHRMISEAAYYRYTERGYADGYDVDDWTAAEAEIDHLLLNPEPGKGSAVSH